MIVSFGVSVEYLSLLIDKGILLPLPVLVKSRFDMRLLYSGKFTKIVVL